MAIKKVTWILPASVLVAVGVLAYALYNPASANTSNGSGVQFPGFTGLSPTAPSSPNSTQTPATFASQGYNNAPLAMPTGNIPNIVIPQINVPPMTVNNYNGAACGGCGNF